MTKSLSIDKTKLEHVISQAMFDSNYLSTFSSNKLTQAGLCHLYTGAFVSALNHNDNLSMPSKYPVINHVSHLIKRTNLSITEEINHITEGLNGSIFWGGIFYKHFERPKEVLSPLDYERIFNGLYHAYCEIFGGYDSSIGSRTEEVFSVFRGTSDKLFSDDEIKLQKLSVDSFFISGVSNLTN